VREKEGERERERERERECVCARERKLSSRYREGAHERECVCMCMCMCVCVWEKERACVCMCMFLYARVCMCVCTRARAHVCTRRHFMRRFTECRVFCVCVEVERRARHADTHGVLRDTHTRRRFQESPHKSPIYIRKTSQNISAKEPSLHPQKSPPIL